MAGPNLHCSALIRDRGGKVSFPVCALRKPDPAFQSTTELNLLKRSVLIALALSVFGALAISALEGQQEQSIQDLGEGLWWSFSTVVTGGFAGLYNPTTPTRRVVTVGMILLGLVLPGTLANDYLYTRMPMTLAHHMAVAFYAAQLEPVAEVVESSPYPELLPTGGVQPAP